MTSWTTRPAFRLDLDWESATTNTREVLVRLNRRTTGTAANFIGGKIEMQAEDDAGGLRDAAWISWDLSNASTADPAGRLFLGSRYANEAVAISNLGNVGIGTTGPGYKLDVAGATSGSDPITVRIMGRHVTTDGVASTLLFGNDPNSPVDLAKIVASRKGFNDQGTLQLTTRNANSGSFGTGLVIDESGNVGIGTTSPGAKLDVNGTIRTQGYLEFISQTGGSDIGLKAFNCGAGNSCDAVAPSYGSYTCIAAIYQGGGRTTCDDASGGRTCLLMKCNP